MRRDLTILVLFVLAMALLGAAVAALLPAVKRGDSGNSQRRAAACV